MNDTPAASMVHPSTTPPRRGPARPARVLWYAVGSIVTVLSLAFGLIQVVAVLARSGVPMDVDRSAEAVQRVVVEVGSGSIDIRGTDSTRIRVTGEVRSGLATTEHSEQLVGSDYVVRSRCPNAIVSSFCEAHLVLEVPRSLAVRIDSSDTAVSVSDLDGPLDVRTSNETIRADRLGSIGPVTLTSANGAILAEDLATPDITMRTSNEDITARFAVPPRNVVIDTSNDRVLVVVPDTPDAYAVELRTSNGEERVAVRTDPTSSRRIRVETSNDGAIVRYPVD